MSGLDNQIIRMLVHSSNQYIKEKSERAEAKKEGEVTVLDSPAKMYYAIVGLVETLFFVGVTIWAWHDGEESWVVCGFLLFVLLGIWIFGMGVFHKVILTDETITHCSSFFGIRRTYQLKKLSKAVYVADGDEIKVYKGKRKIFSMHDDMLGGIEASLEYFERAGVEIEDLRPTFYNFRIEPKGSIKLVSKVLSVFFLIIGLWSGAVVIQEKLIEWLPATWAFILISIVCKICGDNQNRGNIKVVQDEIFYHNTSGGSDKTYNFSEISGYRLVGLLKVYRENEEILAIEPTMLGAAMFLARLIEYDIPCWEERKIEEYGDAETQTAIRDLKKETEMLLKRRKNRLPKS